VGSSFFTGKGQPHHQPGKGCYNISCPLKSALLDGFSRRHSSNINWTLISGFKPIHSPSVSLLFGFLLEVRVYISAKSFCHCNNVDCILLYLITVFFIELSLVEVGLDRSEVCEDIVFEAFSDLGASS
jgi:hypothetical protein